MLRFYYFLSETDYLSLDANWKVARQNGETECRKALLNIFADEDEFKKIQGEQTN